MTLLPMLLLRLGVLSLALSAVGLRAAELRVVLVDSGGRAVEAAAVLVNAGTTATAMTPSRIEVRQKNLRFVPSLSVVTVGASVSFTNEDDFDHHVRGSGDGADFEFYLPGVGPVPTRLVTTAAGQR